MVPWTPVQKPWLKQSQYGWRPQQVVPPQQQWGGIQLGGKGLLFGGKGSFNQFGAGGKGTYTGWGAPNRKPPPSVQATFQVDSTARYTGTVDFYAKWKGYGFITLDEKGLIPNDRLFVHWKQVMSDDRYPFLQKDIQVECSIGKQKDFFNPNLWTLRAQNVSMMGGINVALQDEIDAQTKQFVGGQHLRYTGNLKFFNSRRGFGYVVMDQGYDVEAGVPNELRVDASEVNAGGQQPKSMEKIAVEFGIWKTPRGGYKVYNMTLPGGHPLTQDALENRISMGALSYTGEVSTWNWKQGWGFVKTAGHITLPPRVVAKLQQQVQAARQRGRTITDDKLLYFRRDDCVLGFSPQKGAQVMFQIYIDDKGAGAYEVTGNSV